jgi:hypothetical protein
MRRLNLYRHGRQWLAVTHAPSLRGVFDVAIHAFDGVGGRASPEAEFGASSSHCLKAANAKRPENRAFRME